MSLRLYLYLALFCLASIPAYAKDEMKALTDYLDHIIENKDQFTAEKEQKINDLKRLLDISELSLKQEFDITQKLYQEYKKYILDSAIYYTKKSVELAELLKEDILVYKSRLQLATLYSCYGMYRESEDILKKMHVDALPEELYAAYYEAYTDFFRHYSGGIFPTPQHLVRQQQVYRDSLMAVLDPSSYGYKINQAIKYVNRRNTVDARELLTSLLENVDIDSPQYATITYYMGIVNRIEGDHNAEKKYFMLSAIADLKNSIKENASFQSLASIYYETGDIARAFKYTQSAIEDAVFCNIQFRTAQMSKFYSIINASYQAREAKAKSHIILYLILISILSVFLVLLVLYVYRQMKKISDIKEELAATNSQLTHLNDELNANNGQLLESNYIKEQYIAHFFDLCSTYITKMENYRKTLYKIAANRQFEELVKRLKSTTLLEEEIDELYKQFDSIFLSIYPTFVTEFNSLLVEEEQFVLKSDNSLNTELRIYALLRLGISDNTKIASFLRCSMSTVYNYRTKMRNKAVVSRDEFENKVLNIGIQHPAKG